MYPAMEWMIIASIAAVIVWYASYRRWSKGKLKGDLFFWSVLCPFYTFLGTLALVGKYEAASNKVIEWLNRFFEWATRTIGLRATQVIIAVGVTFLGFMAHSFKKKNQKWYGRVEMLFGFLTAFIVAGTLSSGTLELARWATLAGAAYVIARGRGNTEEAKAKVASSKVT